MECVACSTSLLDPLSPPVKQTCMCAARVCIECRLSVNKCPFCRERTLGETADLAYISEVIRKKRSIRCEGCFKTVSTRLARDHFATCGDYLRGRILDGRIDRRNIANAYRDMCSVNQGLRARNFQLQEQISVIFNSMGPYVPPPPPPPMPPPPQLPQEALTVRIAVSAGEAAGSEHRLLHP